MGTNEDTLQQFLGADAHFKPGQAEALAHLAEQQSVIALLPTGGGKSLIYQLYGLQHAGTVVIVSPLIALMEDQVAGLHQNGVAQAVALNSTLTTAEQQEVLRQLATYRFIFLSPEMLTQPAVLARFQQLNVSLFVVDEAHCISQWGLDFRVEYTDLLAVRRKLNLPLTLALTATATPETLAAIQQYLFYPHEAVKTVAVSLDRPNIVYDRRRVEPDDKPAFLGAALQALPKPGIVYVHQKAEAETLAQTLSERYRLHMATYHADHSAEERFYIQQQFQNGQLDAILATSAFGMGINQPDVRFVIHYHLPKSLTALIQEMGRAGRDGQAAYVLTLFSAREFQQLQRLTQKQYLTDEFFFDLLTELFTRGSLRAGEQRSLDESTLSLLRFYHTHFHQPKQALAHYQRYRQQKAREVAQVIAYCQTPMCLRAYLLQAFGQEKPDTQGLCCAVDDGVIQETPWWDTYQQSGRTITPLTTGLPDWRTRLNELFLS